MNLKDWILLLVPIFSNGVIIFILQKTFERKQLRQAIKDNYALTMRELIDETLDVFYSQMLRVASTGNIDVFSEKIVMFFEKVEAVDIFYRQNEVVFKSMADNIANIRIFVSKATSITESFNSSEQKTSDLEEYEKIFFDIKDELLKIKEKCINLKY